MELKVIVLAAAVLVCLGAILTSASCQGNHFNPSFYASEISHPISDVNRDVRVSQVTLPRAAAGGCEEVWRGF